GPPVLPAATPLAESAVPGGVDGQKTVISKRSPASGPTFVRAANPFEMGAVLAGEQLGHFRLEEFIGGGGMGAVFRATDTTLGRTVAVKVVSCDETNEDALKRFRNEAQSAARLDHPNIARVYYVGEDKGWNYIVFEYIEGVNVRDLVEHNGPLSLEDSIKYTLQMAEALEHAAQRDVTHRDIKPSNILIMIDGRAKLVDMGLARLHQVESSTSELTASGVTLGTFDYISPEQARDPRNTDVRSDLYSLGCTLFFMLVGQPPFPDGTVLQKLLSHSSDEPPDVRQHRPDLPEDITAVVNKMLAKSPEQRFQSPRELIGELLLLADRLNLTAITANSTVWLAPVQPEVVWWVQHLPWLVPTGILAVVVLLQTWLDSARSVSLPPPPSVAVTVSNSENDAAKKVLERPSGRGPLADARPPSAPLPLAPPGTNGVPPAALPNQDAATRKEPDQSPKAGLPKSQSLESPAPELQSPDSQSPDSQSPDSENKRSQGVLAEPRPETVVPKLDSKSPVAPALEDRKPPLPAADPVDPRTAAANTPPVKPVDERAVVVPVSAPHIVVVSDQDVQLDRSMLCVRTMEEAIDTAEKLDQVDEIQLRFNGIRAMRPLDLELDRFGQGKLTIRAAEGFAPIVAFGTNQDRAAPPERTSMIRVHRGHLVWQDTHFYLGCSTSAEELSACTLFELDAVNAVEFKRCSFTIRNLGPDAAPSARRAAVFDLLPVNQLDDVVYDLDPLANTPTIRLADCVARGQAVLVRAEQAMPFWLNWDQGLFLSSEQLVDVGGTMVEPQWAMGRVTLGLKRLLVFADRGICLVRTDSNNPYQVGMTVKTQACLFATQLTKPATPMYLFRGSSPLANEGSQLSISGSNNYYKNTKVVLRVESNSGEGPLEEFSFDDLKELEGQTWYSERNPQPATVFSWLPPAHTVDRQTLDDFIEPAGGDGWFMGDLEISLSALPRFPDYSSLLPRADLRLTPAGSQAARGS
ncbi:MAG: protein kinase domain-containing protein, partial [Pirellulaceae bacterium]